MNDDTRNDPKPGAPCRYPACVENAAERCPPWLAGACDGVRVVNDSLTTAVPAAPSTIAPLGPIARALMPASAPAAPVAQWERIPVACAGIEEACDKILAVVDQRREPGWSYRNTITANRNVIRSLVAYIREAHAAPAAPVAPVGWALVPAEATWAMLDAFFGHSCGRSESWRQSYRDMLAAAPAAPVAQGEPLPGWKFNHARRHPDPDQDGAWEIGFLDDEDDRFSPIITVDTGLYFQDDQAEPLARAILEKLAAPSSAPASQPVSEPVLSDADINKLACAAGFSPGMVVTDNGAFGRFARAVLALRPKVQPVSEPSDALGYATRLAVSLHARHYPDVAQWKPLPDLLGVLTQIDNMVCGIALRPKVQPLTDKQMHKALKECAESIDASSIIMTHWPQVARAIERAHGIGDAA